MAGKVIGQRLNIGYPGAVSRACDAVIQSYPVAGGEIAFGAPVAYDAATGCVTPVTEETAAESIIGIAAREVRQPYADDSAGWYYREGGVCNVLVRGSIIVSVKDTSDVTGRGAVHVGNGAGEVPAGAFVGKEVAGATIPMANAIYSTGRVDADGAAEITLLERRI